MAEKCEEDEEVTEVVEHFEMLTTVEQMRKALEGIKLSLKSRAREEREDEIKGEVADVFVRLNGNSTEKIAELEKEYDFTDVPLVYRDQAKKWYNAPRPSSSRKYIGTHPEVLSAYNSWLKWNLTKQGGQPHNYKGDLVKKREEEAGAAM
jgi:hypothetical protein